MKETIDLGSKSTGRLETKEKNDRNVVSIREAKKETKRKRERERSIRSYREGCSRRRRRRKNARRYAEEGEEDQREALAVL